jgi:hypothetical protein
MGDGAVTTVALHHVAHGRTGDKGDRSNISVIALRPELYDVLVSQVTEDRVAGSSRIATRGRSSATSCPSSGAMNFVIDGVLDGGVNGLAQSRHHGKTLAFLLLELPSKSPHTSRRRQMKIRILSALAAALALSFTATRRNFPRSPIHLRRARSPPAAPRTRLRARSASPFSEQLKQSVRRSTTAGRERILAAQQTAKSPADGYTVLITTKTTHAANEHSSSPCPTTR